MKKSTWFSGCLIIIGLLVLTSQSVVAQEADLILRNGVIWTVDDANPQVESVATLDGKII